MSSSSSRARRVVGVSLFVFALTSFAGVSSAQTRKVTKDFDGFKTPSGNVTCSLIPADEGEAVDCSITDYSGPVPKVPADCDLDWQARPTLGTTGRAELFGCAGDTSFNGSLPVAAYGSKILMGRSITCTVATTGVTCKNRSGRGFLISRKVIKRV